MVCNIGGERVYTVAAYQFENLAKLVTTAKAAALAAASTAGAAPASPAVPAKTP